MSYQEDRLLEIADAIREKDGSSAPIKAIDFAERILAIEGGGGGGDEVTLEDLLNYPMPNWLTDPDFDEAWHEMLNGPPELYNIDLTLAASDQDFGWGVNLDFYVGDLDQFYNDCVNGVLIAGSRYNINDNDMSYFGDASAMLGFPVPLFMFINDDDKYVFLADLTSMDMGLGKAVGCFSGEPFTSPLIIKRAEIVDANSNRLIILPYDMTSVDDNAFENYKMTSIVIPNSVTSIGSSACLDCSSLMSINIPNSVTSIGDSAFSNCSSLMSINIPNSVTSIGDSAFSNCSSLTSIVIPNSVTSIDYHAFSNCSSLTSINIPNSVTSIGYNAFSGCSSLTSITIPNSVTSIGSSVCLDCSSLMSINIPNSVTSIGHSAFSGCSSLTSIVIPNSVTSIDRWTFFNCTGLKSITIPDSVTSIGSAAFSDCSSVLNYDFVTHTTIPSLSETTAFSNINTNCRILVPVALESAWKAATNWATYADYIVGV